MNVLEINNVTKRFGNLVAVRDVSLSVAKGELRAIIGPNGAGKTTFFNLISGFFRRPSGTIRFDGRDITKLAAHERVTLGMARTFQITEIFPELTVFENVRIAAEVAGGYRLRPWITARETAQIHRARRGDAQAGRARQPKPTGWSANSRTATSAPPKSRWRSRLKPHLLLLDEPTAGMGDQETYQITQLIRRLHRDSNYTIVLIEHDMRVVFHLADRISVLDQGRMLAAGHAAGDCRQRGRAGRLSGQGRMTAALTAEGLHTYYGKSHILHGVSLEVAEGKITALLGRNGAGKTTTLRSLMGLTPAREGRITIFGEDTTRWPTFRIAALGRRLCARRPAHLCQSQRRGKPQGPARARGAVDHRAHLPAVSAPRGAQVQPRPPALRRRAGDAVDRPRPAAQSDGC